MKYTEMIGVKLTPEQLDWVKREAMLADRGVGNYVRQLIEAERKREER